MRSLYRSNEFVAGPLLRILSYWMHYEKSSTRNKTKIVAVKIL
jgi:hypothetical protein